jgi:hypothetical protein
LFLALVGVATNKKHGMSYDESEERVRNAKAINIRCVGSKVSELLGQ